MHLTLVTGYQAAAVLRHVCDNLYTERMKRKIFAFKKSLHGDSIYRDLHHTVSGQVDELVNKLCYLEEPLDAKKVENIHRLLIGQSMAVQMYLFERFLWAAECFFESGPKFLNGIHTEIQTLYYGLVYLWETRETKQQ